MCYKRSGQNKNYGDMHAARARAKITFFFQFLIMNFLSFFHVERMDIFIFCICIIENSISNISSQFVHFCKAIYPGWWWAHGKYFTKLEVASPAHPPCGLRAHGTILLSLKRHRTWLIMVLGTRTHGVRF